MPEIPFFVSLVHILVPLGLFALCGAIVISALAFKHKRRQMWHETARLALEKGQPIPQWDDDAPAAVHAQRSRARNDLTGGLVLIAIGLGMFLTFSLIGHEGGIRNARLVGYFGLIPGFMGLALLIASLINGRINSKVDDSGGSSPKS